MRHRSLFALVAFPPLVMQRTKTAPLCRPRAVLGEGAVAAGAALAAATSSWRIHASFALRPPSRNGIFICAFSLLRHPRRHASPFSSGVIFCRPYGGGEKEMEREAIIISGPSEGKDKTNWRTLLPSCDWMKGNFTVWRPTDQTGIMNLSRFFGQAEEIV